MKHTVEYAVLGAGVVGSSTAYLLARAGYSTALVERFDIGHVRGSSHGESRITRVSYDQPIYIQMAKRTFDLWFEVEKESGAQLYLRTGSLDIGIPGDSRLEACRTSMDSEKVEYAVLDRAEIARQYPQFNLRSDALALWQQQTGILSASLCVQTLAGLAASNGTHLFANTRVNRIAFTNDKILLEADECSIEASHLIICAGSWAGPLLRTLGLELSLTVTQEQWAFFEPLDADDFLPGKFPIFIEYYGVGSGGIGWYGLPVFGKAGVKTAIHRSGNVTTADDRTFEADPERLAELRVRMEELLPRAAGEIISVGTCLYTNSADHNFVIDFLPGHSNVVLFTGCSGHAFKFGPVIGETLINLLQHKSVPFSLDLFRAQRFAVR